MRVKMFDMVFIPTNHDDEMGGGDGLIGWAVRNGKLTPPCKISPPVMRCRFVEDNKPIPDKPKKKGYILTKSNRRIVSWPPRNVPT